MGAAALPSLVCPGSYNHQWELYPSLEVPKLPLAGLFPALDLVCAGGSFNSAWDGLSAVSAVVGRCCTLALALECAGTLQALPVFAGTQPRLFSPVRAAA